MELAISIEKPDIVQKAGTIQFFGVSFELAWKVLMDYLEAQGFNEVQSPRASIKKAFELELIDQGTKWLEALENRNLSAHTYDEATSDRIIYEIKHAYYAMLQQKTRTLNRYE